jgi:hypothetical protein
LNTRVVPGSISSIPLKMLRGASGFFLWLFVALKRLH